MATTDIISEKPDETITQDINSTYKNEPVVTETETETVQPETVVTPSSTTTQPMFSKNERIGYTLLPLASALLQGKRTGGGSMFNDTLASLGQGLMGTTEVALKIKQLEGANKTKASTTRKQYKLQPSAKKVQIGGQIFTPEMGKIISLDDATLAQYPVDTFVEVTKDSKVTSKSIYVEKPFEIDGVKYEIGQREIPQSVINKQLAISPNVFGDAPTEDSDKATFRNYVFLKKKKTFKNKEGKEETKMVNDTSQAYGVFDRGGELFVSVGGELIPQSKLIEEDRLGTLFTKSQFTGLQDRLDVKAFQKLQEKARATQLKLQALRKLIGQSRLDLFGPGVLTEFEQELAKQALVGNDKFINLEVAKSLLLKAARKGISDYEASLAEVHQQNDIRGQDYQYLDFDFRALPLFADDIIQQKKDDGDKF